MAAAAGPAAESQPPLYVALLGPPLVTWQGRPLVLARRQARALLYRVAAAAHPVPRDQLCFLFWPDQPDPIARRSLSNLLNQLRRALPEPDALVADADAVALNRAIAGCDVAHGAWVAPCPHREQLQQASALYRGAFLDGFSLPNCPELDAWRDAERHAWERRYLDILATLVEAEATAGNLASAIAAAVCYLGVDPLAEAMHQRLMALYAAHGDRAAALAQFARCREALERAPGVVPLAQTRALYAAIHEGRQPPDDAEWGARGAAGRLPSSSATTRPPKRAALPAPVMPLLGRAAEVRTACTLLTTGDVRWLTLTGPGGVGKTRLAVEVGRALAEHFADGVLWIPVAPLRDPALVADAIVHACGLAQRGQAPRAQLCAFMRDKHLLLVLDNLEHLQSAVPLLSEVLAAGPRLHLLVTSRMLLNGPNEYALPVPPLPLPDLGRLPSRDTLAQQPAVALLLARIRQHRHGFQLSTATAADLAAICLRLDGLPLALELAAARLRLLSPRDLLGRLDHRLELLTGGPRDLPARQHTLRATIAWSYDLLDGSAQHVLACLAVFAGGWTLAAAEAVAGAAATGGSVRDGLQRLLDANLIVRHDGRDGAARFEMLETIREFAAEQGHARAAHTRSGRRHATYYCRLAETYGRGLDWPWRAEARSVLEQDSLNIRAALRWAIDANEGALAARIAAAMAPYWEVCGLVNEGRAWQMELLGLDTLSGAQRATLQAQAALLTYRNGSIAEAARLAETVLADTHASPRDRVAAGGIAGLTAAEAGDLDGGYGHCATALALAHQHALPTQAAALEANIGICLLKQGRLDDAEAAIRASYTTAMALEYPRGIGMGAILQGALGVLRGQPQTAAAWLQQGLERLAEAGETTYLVYGLLGCCVLAAYEPQPERCVKLFAATTRHAAEQGLTLALAWFAEVRALVAHAQARMAPAQRDRAMCAGQALAWEETIALALAVTAAREVETPAGAEAP